MATLINGSLLCLVGTTYQILELLELELTIVCEYWGLQMDKKKSVSVNSCLLLWIAK